MLISILLIEDDPNFGELLKFRLGRANSSACFQVHWEKTLSGALSHLDEVHVDLIIADLGLPDSCGPLTVSKLSSVAPNVPLLVLSGEGSDSVMWDVIRCGAEDYIVKAHLETENLTIAILNAIARHYERTSQLATV
jgi:DNA-binding response OmpR family regulator